MIFLVLEKHLQMYILTRTTRAVSCFLIFLVDSISFSQFVTILASQ